MITNVMEYANALAAVRESRRLDPHSCMDFLESMGYSVAALGNEEIIQLAEDILTDMESLDE